MMHDAKFKNCNEVISYWKQSLLVYVFPILPTIIVTLNHYIFNVCSEFIATKHAA